MLHHRVKGHSKVAQPQGHSIVLFLNLIFHMPDVKFLKCSLKVLHENWLCKIDFSTERMLNLIFHFSYGNSQVTKNFSIFIKKELFISPGLTLIYAFKFLYVSHQFESDEHKDSISRPKPQLSYQCWVLP